MLTSASQQNRSDDLMLHTSSAETIMSLRMERSVESGLLNEFQSKSNPELRSTATGKMLNSHCPGMYSFRNRLCRPNHRSRSNPNR